jgi:hypothetical protein
VTPQTLSAQTAIFSVPIERIVNPKHPLCALADKINTRELPIAPSLMTRWRDRIKSEGMEKLLEETIRLGLVTGALKGDRINAVLSGCGYNMRKLVAGFFFCFGAYGCSCVTGWEDRVSATG